MFLTFWRFYISDVLRLGNSTRINERCLELQKNKKEISKIKVLNILVLILYSAIMHFIRHGFPSLLVVAVIKNLLLEAHQIPHTTLQLHS